PITLTSMNSESRELDVSPPIIETPCSSASSATPSKSSSTNSAEQWPGSATLIIANFGTPPIAAISLRFTASALRPSIRGVVQSNRKCTPSTIKSQQASKSVSLVFLRTAASSPMPIRTSPLECERRLIREMISDSIGMTLRMVAPGRQRLPRGHKGAKLHKAFVRLRVFEPCGEAVCYHNSIAHPQLLL